MKVAILGATGATGQALVELALKEGMFVQALVRSPEKLSARLGLSKVVGDVLKVEDVQKAVEGTDVVVLALGMVKGSTKAICSEATKVLMPILEASGPSRLIAISAYGAKETGKSMMGRLLRRILSPEMLDKDTMEDLITSSRLDWTILRPGRLTNGTWTGKYQVGAAQRVGWTSSISRKNLAQCVTDLVNESSQQPRTLMVIG